MRGNRIDANQNEIVRELRKVGATVLITSNLKNAFDILVGFRGELYIVEIKDGSKPPSQRKLTPGETKCKQDFQNVGVKYHIINSVQEAIEMLKE